MKPIEASESLVTGPLPKSLTARGSVNVELTLDGRTANAVTGASDASIDLSPGSVDFASALNQTKDLKAGR